MDTTQPVDAPASDSQSHDLTTKYTRLSLADTELLLKLHYNGQKQTDIAQVLGCSQSTVSDTLAKLKQTPDVVQALMRSDSLTALKDWKRARRQAAKRGDHRPSREWLETAHPELRAQAGNHGGGGVTIIIGQPGQPVQMPTIDVVASQLSPRKLEAASESPSDH